MAHTQTRWIAEGSKVLGPAKEIIFESPCDDEAARGNAAFAVMAVNHHESLVETLKVANAMLSVCSELMRSLVAAGDEENDMEEIHESIEQANRVLAEVGH